MEEETLKQQMEPVQGTTRFDLYCQQCKQQKTVRGTVGEVPCIICPTCHTRMTRYYGNTSEMLINYGERAGHDEFERFRFQNL